MMDEVQSAAPAGRRDPRRPQDTPTVELKAAPSQEDLDLAAKLQEVVRARTVERGAEVSVVKLADVIRIVREILGAFAGRAEAQLQEEIVKLRIELDRAAARVAASEETAKGLGAEVARLAAEGGALGAEIERLRAGAERCGREAAEAARRAEEAERAKACAEERARRLEEVVELAGRSERLGAEVARLEALLAELEERVRSVRSDAQYAQLVEEPPFEEIEAACAALGDAAAKAPPQAGAEARGFAAAAAASLRRDGAAFRRLVEEVCERRGTVRAVARLEVISGVGHAREGELRRWRRALSE